jgi:hypothetical protein
VKGSRQEWDGEMHISALEYHDILQDFDFNCYLKVFSGVLPKSKNFLKL